MKKEWEYKKLGDITVFSQGIQVDVNLQTETFSPGKVRFLRIIDVTQGNVPPRYIDDPGEKYYLKADEIAMVRYGTIGFVCYGIEGVIANNLFKISIKDKSKLQSSYLQYFLKSDLFQSHIRKSVGGAALPSIKFGDIKHIMLGIPPLSEQKEIVEYLDSSFAKIDKLKANAAKNLEEAKALFQSALKDALEPKEGWEEKNLGELSSLITKGASPKWQGFTYVESNGILFVTSENVREGYVSLEPAKYLNKEFNNKQKRSILKYNDLLINIVGASIGRAAIFRLNINDANINQAVALVRLLNNVDVDFINYILNSNIAWKQYDSLKKDSARANLSLENIRSLKIPLPPLSEQQSIVSFLDSLSEKVNTLQQNYSRICDECDALKQAILRQVFE